MPAASTAQQKGPNSSPWQWLTTCYTTNTPKVEQIGLQHFASSAIFTWSLANWLHLFKHLDNFLQEKHVYRKCFPRVHWTLKHRLWCYRKKQTFLLAKNVLIVTVPILLNKDVFKPAYNDLQFMVPNHKLVCTNLIVSLKLTQHCKSTYIKTNKQTNKQKQTHHH